VNHSLKRIICAVKKKEYDCQYWPLIKKIKSLRTLHYNCQKQAALNCHRAVSKQNKTLILKFKKYQQHFN